MSGSALHNSSNAVRVIGDVDVGVVRSTGEVTSKNGGRDNFGVNNILNEGKGFTIPRGWKARGSGKQGNGMKEDQAAHGLTRVIE